MPVFVYCIFIILAGLLSGLIMPGFTKDINVSFYLIITGIFALSAVIILLRKHLSFFKTLSYYIATFLILFVIAEGMLIYYSANTPKTGNEQAIIVTGGGLFVQSRLTDELEMRIDKAIEIYMDNPTLTIVLSGGKDESRTLPQCVAMKSYLVKRVKELGIEEPNIIMEDTSTDISENISLSLEKADIESAHIIVSRHNVVSAKHIAKKLCPKCSIIGAKLPISKYIIYYIRELYFAGKTMVNI